MLRATLYIDTTGSEPGDLGGAEDTFTRTAPRI